MSAPRPPATIAIATYNRSRWLGETLASLAAHLADRPEVEVVIVDNRSTDATAEVAAPFVAAHPSWRIVTESAQGLSHARNRAIAEARGEVIVFLDDDVLIEPGWLDALLDPWRGPDAEKIGAVGGEVVPVFPEGCPKWLEGWATPLCLRPDAGPLSPRQMPMGANLALPREVFARFGGFGGELGRKGKSLLAGEETEFLKRLHRGGLQVWFAPQAVVRHQFPAARMNFGYACRHGFDSARSRVVEAVTDAERPRANRLVYCFTRLDANLLKSLFLLPLAGILFLLGRRDGARWTLIRLARCGGYVYQIVASLPRVLR